MLVLAASSSAEPIDSLEAYYESLHVPCATAEECEVKNVGNCCGMLPRCVHRNAVPNLAAVREYCEKQGVVSICGFQPIEGCQCTAGRCVARSPSQPLSEIQ